MIFFPRERREGEWKREGMREGKKREGKKERRKGKKGKGKGKTGKGKGKKGKGKVKGREGFPRGKVRGIEKGGKARFFSLPA